MGLSGFVGWYFCRGLGMSAKGSCTLLRLPPLALVILLGIFQFREVSPVGDITCTDRTYAMQQLHLIDTTDKRSHDDLQWEKSLVRTYQNTSLNAHCNLENKLLEHSKSYFCVTCLVLPVGLIIWFSVSASGSISDTNFHQFSRIFHWIFRGFFASRQILHNYHIYYTI